jgi:hypothetical protein
VFQNRKFSKIFGTKKDEVSSKFRAYNDGICGSNIVK